MLFRQYTDDLGPYVGGEHMWHTLTGVLAEAYRSLI